MIGNKIQAFNLINFSKWDNIKKLNDGSDFYHLKVKYKKADLSEKYKKLDILMFLKALQGILFIKTKL